MTKNQIEWNRMYYDGASLTVESTFRAYVFGGALYRHRTRNGNGFTNETMIFVPLPQYPGGLIDGKEPPLPPLFPWGDDWSEEEDRKWRDKQSS